MRRQLRAIASRLFLTRRRAMDDEARQEIETHLEMLAERYEQAGLTRDAAWAAARRQFGNPTLAREEVYRLNGFAWIDGLVQDVRYGCRRLRHAAATSAVIIATFALGIGGTTAVFSVVHAVLIESLPYEEPGELVRLYQEVPSIPESRTYLTGPHFKAVRAHSTSFEHVAAIFTYSETGLDLVAGGQARRLRVLQVSGDYFSTLGRALSAGHGFGPQDEAGARRVVVSQDLWRRQFHADDALVGATIHLDGEPYEVAGIATGGFSDPVAGTVDAWVPYDLDGNDWEQNYSLTAVGRLRDGVELEEARAELAVLSDALAAQWPNARASRIRAVPLKEDLVSTSRPVLQAVFVAVGLVLLVACVNVANLLLLRAASRSQEFAVRVALGSGRARLVRQLLVESLLLATAGGALGLLVASGGVRVLRTLGQDAIPRLGSVELDPLVLAFSAGVTLVTAVVAGTGPALRSARTDPAASLGLQSRSATGGRAQGRTRAVLAVTQLSLACMLLAAAGTLLVSFARLQRVDLGIRTEGILTFEVGLPEARYDATRRAAFHETLASTLAAMPGIAAAGAVSRLPATGSFHPWSTAIETGPLAGTSIGRPHPVQQRTVSGRFFEAMGVPLLAGRTFDSRDTKDVPGRAIISASFARQAFPGLSLDAVIGQRIQPLDLPREIIGVVGDTALDTRGAPALVVYHWHPQVAENRNWKLTHVVAGQLPTSLLVNTVSAQVSALDPQLVVHHAMPLEDIIGRSSRREWFALVLMGAFAGVSLLLAALGLYGVLAFSVRQRTAEIGIRIALGANPPQIRWLFVRQAGVVLAAGLALGVPGALLLGRQLAALLFQTTPWDPRVLAATVTLLVITAALATWAPSRRASRLAPRMSMHEPA